MHLTFLGAAQTVTGSKHLLTLDDGTRLLLDCGLYQGRRDEAHRLNREWDFDPAEVNAVLLSHAHIDHSGLLPRLWADGFRGRIYATHATYDLCALMLMDSGHIQEKDVEFVNKRHRERGKPPVEPLYTAWEAEKVLSHFVGVGYGQPFRPVPNVEVEYRDAGHILGSATMVLTVTEGGKTTKIGFTGDVGMPARPILRDPQPMADCDVLITESTYGGKTHLPGAEAKARLLDVIRRTAARGGKVLIPAFAVGRTQELVHDLDQLWNDDTLPPIPFFVDSPLAVNATGVFQAHPECFDAELQDYLRRDHTPFGFDKLEYVRDVERSKAINGLRGPAVVISASGMCEAGRILHHLRNNIEDPRTTILIVGFQAEHTLGRRLVEEQPFVRIFGEEFQRKAEVVVLNYFSAHADEPFLLKFIGQLDPERLRRLFLVHGDLARQEALRTALHAAGHRHVEIPARGDVFAV